MLIIDNKFDIGQTVYLITDKEQLPRIVTGMSIRVNGGLTYNLCCGTVDTWHYECEISNEQNKIFACL